MSMEMHVASASPKALLQTVLSALKQGSVGMAVEQFDDQFTFVDHGLGLEFEDKGRLTEFFTKARELYPDSAVLVDFLLETDDYVIAEWTLRGTLVEPYFGGLTRRVPITLPGVSIVRTYGGKIIHWSDYYDSLMARRSALAAFFTAWVEL